MAGHIDQALHLLPPRQKLAFQMKYIEDLKVDEIAQEMGCSSNSIKKHLGRALAALRRRLGPIWSQP
jgi:RNA polymerase sigma-70 factor (ECF subfamily)